MIMTAIIIASGKFLRSILFPQMRTLTSITYCTIKLISLVQFFAVRQSSVKTVKIRPLKNFLLYGSFKHSIINWDSFWKLSAQRVGYKNEL